MRQTVATIADVLVNPEEITRAIELGIPERLAKLLLSEDPFIREKVAIVYGTMCCRAAGREAILRNLKILNNLSTGIADPLPVVRAKMAQVLEVLARHPPAAQQLCLLGFMEVIFDRIVNEQESAILVVHLESLESLMLLNEKVKMRALKINGMEKLLAVLRHNDEEKVVAGALSCTAILCEPIFGKEKSYELDILPILATLLDDQRCAIVTKAVNVIVFMTTISSGKSRAFELNVIEKLVKFAVNCTRDRELQLASIKALTNIAEHPKGRAMLLSDYFMLIEDLDTGGHPTVEEHKHILLEVIRWRP